MLKRPKEGEREGGGASGRRDRPPGQHAAAEARHSGSRRVQQSGEEWYLYRSSSSSSSSRHAIGGVLRRGVWAGGGVTRWAGFKGSTMQLARTAPAFESTAELFLGTEFGHIFDEMLQQLGSPVEFQLPDWLFKQKTSPYTFIKRNMYLTKKIKTRAEDDGIFCSCKPSPGTSVVCDRDCLCGMLLSSCSQNCNCGDLCLNKPFQHRPVKKMKLVQTEKCGSGIIADEDIKQGEFVIEYVGEVIDDKTCEDRLWQMKHRGETNFYLCEINRDMVIDATFKGNKSRYINHSCQPNTEMQKWIMDGETRIGIFATRDIKKGEDLTYDYQFVQFGADQDCYCGSVHCRRKLGNKPSKSKPSSSDIQFGALLYGGDDLVTGRSELGSSYLLSSYRRHCLFTNCIDRVIKVWSSRNRRYYGGVISEFDSHSKKHTILKEDGEYEVLDLSMEDWELLDELM